MRISLRLQSLGLWCVLLRPNLRPAEEEPLLRGEAVNISRMWLTLERLHKRVIRDIEAAQIRDRLAGDELALHMQTWLNFKTIKLVDDTIRTLVETLLITFG